MSRRGCSRGKAEEKAIEIGPPEHVRAAPAPTPGNGESSVKDGLPDTVGRTVADVRRGLPGGQKLSLDPEGRRGRRRGGPGWERQFTGPRAMGRHCGGA